MTDKHKPTELSDDELGQVTGGNLATTISTLPASPPEATKHPAKVTVPDIKFGGGY